MLQRDITVYVPSISKEKVVGMKARPYTKYYFTGNILTYQMCKYYWTPSLLAVSYCKAILQTRNIVNKIDFGANLWIIRLRAALPKLSPR